MGEPAPLISEHDGERGTPATGDHFGPLRTAGTGTGLNGGAQQHPETGQEVIADGVAPDPGLGHYLEVGVGWRIDAWAPWESGALLEYGSLNGWRIRAALE